MFKFLEGDIVRLADSYFIFYEVPIPSVRLAHKVRTFGFYDVTLEEWVETDRLPRIQVKWLEKV